MLRMVHLSKRCGRCPSLCRVVRMMLVIEGRCVLRYDNEPGKGDHRHVGDQEMPYAFSTPGRLFEDFYEDVVSGLEDVKRRFVRAFEGKAQGACISFETPALLFRVLSGKRWELLATMTGAGPMTIREAARRAGR
jgi:hypothetical protein